jgi:hypothetical protein
MLDDGRPKHPLLDRKNRPSQWLLILMAVGIAVAVTLFGGLVLYIAEIWRARPLGM